MKKHSTIEQLLRLAVHTLAGIAACAFSAGAAQETFDIDLKELRPAPSRSTGAAKDAFEIELKELKPAATRRESVPHPARRAKPAAPKPSPRPGPESSYTVRPGDNLYLILIRQYELSNAAAERIIPEIVRRNDIRDPQRLTLGQRLIIPLAAKSRKPPESSAENTLPPVQPSAPVVPVVQPPATETAQEREIVVEAAAPCLLARNVAKELGLQIPSLSVTSHPENVSVGYYGLKMEVVCGLSPAEAYTYERLLSPHGIQLLVFNGEVPPRRVVEELADRLELSFWLAGEDASDELPVTYVFPAADPAEKSVRLTIRPAPPTTTP